MDETLDLTTVDNVFHVAVEEGRHDVELDDLETFGNSKCKQYSQRVNLPKRRIGIIIIKSFDLMVTKNNPPRLVPRHPVELIALAIEYPHASQYIGSGRWINQRANIMLEEGVDLFLHGVLPSESVRARHCLGIGGVIRVAARGCRETVSIGLLGLSR